MTLSEEKTFMACGKVSLTDLGRPGLRIFCDEDIRLAKFPVDFSEFLEIEKREG